jgi:adenylate cyclase
VESVLAARIDRLSARDKSLLQSAAVLGREFGESVLERIAELSEPDLAAALRALTGGEFIYQQALYPEAEYAFKHALTQEVAYGTQLADRRAHVHAAVAQAIEELYPDSLDERAALVAQHWEGGGDLRQAMRWHARAAAWAGLSDAAEAMRHWRRVRELASSLPEDAESLGIGVAARVWILQFGWRLGLAEKEAEGIFEEGRDLAQRGGDQASQILLNMTYAGIRGFAGEMHSALQIMEETNQLARELGDPGLLVALPQFLVYGLYNVGRWDDALVEADKWLRLLELHPEAGLGIVVRSPRAAALFLKAAIHINRGEIEAGEHMLGDAVATARAANDLETESWARMMFANVGYIVLDRERALTPALKAVELTERIGDALSRSWALTWCGAAQIVAGDPQAAIELLEEALAISRETRVGMEGEPARLAFLAEALVAAGHTERALAIAEDAVRTARERRLDGLAPNALLASGRARCAAGDLDGADAALLESIERSRTLGGRPTEAVAHELLSNVAAARGDLDRAEGELRAAVALYEQIDARGRIELANARLEELATA